jgi:diguanylate cyclase (GGDEF)-like protein
MKWLSRFLCPTELDRTRAAEAGARTRRARTLCAGAMGAALVLVAPWQGWWTLGLFALVAVNLATLEWRMRRSHYPEVHAAASQLFVLLVIGAGVAIDGGPTSPVLSWLVIPGAIVATRFRREVVVAGAGLTALVLCAATVPVDPAAVADDPSPLIATMALLGCVTAVTSALMSGEIFHRGRAVLDPLTGLLNRSALESRLVEIEQQARLTGGSVSLVVLDLDHFKQVNDTHGHDRGDAVLRDVAYEMRKALRSFELMYRIGGEEFVVLLPGLPVTDAVEIAERVRRAVESARPGDLELTVSAGVATGSGHEVTYERLFRAADSALLEAKREGRNRVRAAAEGIPLVPVPDVRALMGDETAARVS